MWVNPLSRMFGPWKITLYWVLGVSGGLFLLDWAGFSYHRGLAGITWGASRRLADIWRDLPGLVALSMMSRVLALSRGRGRRGGSDDDNHDDKPTTLNLLNPPD